MAMFLGILAAIAFFLGFAASLAGFSKDGSDIQLILGAVYFVVGMIAMVGAATLYALQDLQKSKQ